MSAAQGFLRHFENCNRRDLSKFVPFFIDGQQYGYILHELMNDLLNANSTFQRHDNGLMLTPSLTDFDSRSQALHAASDLIGKKYNIDMRCEMYPVVQQWGDEPLAKIDRAAVPWFGIKGFGIHVNGFVRKPNGLYLWIGERAMDRLVDPAKLDNMIGGGQPIGLSLEENLCKEAKEEAGFDASLAMTAKRVGCITYQVERHKGLRNDVLYIYDLELPADVQPRNTDGEVAAFHLMPLAEVATIVSDTDRFKFNCNLVIIDFLMRHGFLRADHPEYNALIGYIEKPAIL